AHQAQQGGLAATGRPHDARDLAARNADIDVIEDAARPALEGQSLQLDRVGVIGTHLNSLGCSLSLRHHACDKRLQPLCNSWPRGLGGPNWRRTISLLVQGAQGRNSACSDWGQGKIVAWDE